MRSLCKALLCLNLTLTAASAFGQDAKGVQEPEYLSVFFYVNPDGSLKALERQTPEQKIKVKGLGFGGGEGFIQILGERSPVRFKGTDRLEFVVLAASQQIDPSGLIQFFSFEPKKGVRRLMLSKVGSMGTSSKSVATQAGIPFDAAKYGKSSFKLVPANELPYGEYCLSTSSTAAAFCFGVDRAADQD